MGSKMVEQRSKTSQNFSDNLQSAMGDVSKVRKIKFSNRVIIY